MSVNTKHEDAITKRLAVNTHYGETISRSFSFEELAEILTPRGGKLVELDDPKLTHIVLDDRDTTRRIELMNRTST